MPLVVDLFIALFADDAYIYRTILTQTDANKLQKDLNSLVIWEKNWSMDFHLDKCHLLRITIKRKVIDGNYTIHDKELKLFDSAKYLGATLSKNLSWKHHIGIITAIANSTQLFLQRNLVKLDKETKLKCYHVFIRPILEYASTVWNPVNQITLNGSE